MHVEESIKQDVAVVSIKGELVGDNDELVLQQKVSSLRSDGFTKLIFDLGNVNRINSRGLSALISTAKTMRSAGGDLRIARIDRHMSDIFMKTRLVRVFETFETVGRALASYT
jgi:anti-sigma B factor antagonist